MSPKDEKDITTVEDSGLRILNRDRPKFCPKCGFALDTEEDQKYCPKCKAGLPESVHRPGKDTYQVLEARSEDLLTSISSKYALLEMKYKCELARRKKLEKEIEEKDEELKEYQYDELTGLMTRKMFLPVCHQTLKTYKRINRRTPQEKLEIPDTPEMSRPVCMLMIDIDFFKKVNDTYGHPIGDIVLSKVSGVLSRTGRDSDVCCRFGGEEFVILLPDCSEEVAVSLASALRQRISVIRINAAPLSFHDPLNEAEREKVYFGVTATIGVSSMRRMDQGFEEIVDLSDKALFYGKQEAGRDCIVLNNQDGTFTVHKTTAE